MGRNHKYFSTVETRSAVMCYVAAAASGEMRGGVGGWRGQEKSKGGGEGDK